MKSRPSILGALGGAVGGLGVAVLLQQFAVAYPTPTVLALCVLGGILVNLIVVGLAGSLGGANSAPPATAAGQPAPSSPAHPTTPPWTASSAITGPAPTYSEPNPSVVPSASLRPGTPVQLLQRQGGWAQVRCENGFVAWIDGQFVSDPVG